MQGLTVVTHVLREGGKFIAKIFRGKDTSLLYCQVNYIINDQILFHLEIFSMVFSMFFHLHSFADLFNWINCFMVRIFLVCFVLWRFEIWMCRKEFGLFLLEM